MPISDLHRRRRGRNLAIAAVLVCLVALFFFITIIKLGSAGA
jgi:hypothetical protein